MGVGGGKGRAGGKHRAELVWEEEGEHGGLEEENGIKANQMKKQEAERRIDENQREKKTTGVCLR